MKNRCIDAGFSAMKFSRPSQDGSGVEFSHFPSIAIPTQPQAELPKINSGRDITLVQFGDHTYMVGPDAHYELAGSDFARDLTDGYYSSSTYHALMRGALALMGDEYIDVLVLGLPMDRFEYPEIAERLKKEYEGVIDLGFNRRVEIKNVVVHPQPFGGYVGLSQHVDGINSALEQYPDAQIAPLADAMELQNLNVLVVDTGAFTLDWLFMSPKGPVRAASSAANNAGRHRVIQRVYEQVCKEMSRKPPISYLLDIDNAERLGKPCRIDGRVFNFKDERFQNIILEAVDDSVQQMFAHLGGNADRIDLIAVVGGEPRHVAEAIKRRRPHIPLFVTPVDGKTPSIFTNLAGFQEYADAISQNMNESSSRG